MIAYLRSLGQENNDLIYTFSKNLGGEMLSPAAYYVGNPLNFIANWFSQRELPTAILILVLIRYGLAGLAFYFFLRGTQTLSGVCTLLFSTSYALSAYMVINSENLHYTDGVVLLPLVALGLWRLMALGCPFLYIFSLAAMILINYYIGFMICLFSLLFALFLFLLKPNVWQKGNWLPKSIRFLVSSLIAGGLSMFRLIPTLLQLSDGQKSPQTNAMNFSLNFNVADFFSRNFSGAFDDFQIKFGLPSIFCGVLITCLVAAFFANGKISRREKLLSAGFLLVLYLSFQVRLLNLIWHGGSEPIWWQYRNAFIFCFLMVWIAARSWHERSGFSPLAALLCMAGLALMTFIVWRRQYPYLSRRALLLDLLLCGLFFGLMVLLRNHSNSWLQKIGVLLIFCAAFYNLTDNARAILNINLQNSTSAADFALFVDQTGGVMAQIKDSDPDFYRIEKNYARTINDALQFSSNGISHYSSTAKPAVLKFFERLGVDQTIYWSSYGRGGTLFADSFLGIKYLLWRDTWYLKPWQEVFRQWDVSVLENPDVFPIGFITTKNVLLTGEPDSKNAFENQNRIFNSLLSVPVETDNQLLAPIAITAFETHNLRQSLVGKDETLYEKVDPNHEAWLRWDLLPRSEWPLYAYFPATLRKNADMAEMSVNGKPIGKLLGADQFGILPLGTFAEEKPVRVQLNLLASQLTIGGAFFYGENVVMLQQMAKNINAQRIQLDKLSSSHLSGKLPSELLRGSYAFFTIPYEDDWRVWVDQVQMDPIRVLGGLMAIPLPAGAVSIELRYVPKGLLAGILISSVSFICVLLWIFLLGKLRRIRR